MRFVWTNLAGALLLLVSTSVPAQQQGGDKKNTAPNTVKAGSKAGPASQEKPLTPDEELQEAIDSAGNDRVALVRNLE